MIPSEFYDSVHKVIGTRRKHGNPLCMDKYKYMTNYPYYVAWLDYKVTCKQCMEIMYAIESKETSS